MGSHSLLFNRIVVWTTRDTLILADAPGDCFGELPSADRKF